MNLEKATSRLSFITTFLDKLGDVSLWEHKGEVVDAGKGSKEKCICGHPIRYLYIIENNGKRAQVGSECINHFQGYNEALFNSLTSTIARLKEEEKKAKEMMLLKEVEAVKTPYETKVRKVIEWYNDSYGGRYCSDYGVWNYVNRIIRYRPSKNYKSVKTLLNWYIKNDSSVSAFILNNNI